MANVTKKRPMPAPNAKSMSSLRVCATSYFAARFKGRPPVEMYICTLYNVQSNVHFPVQKCYCIAALGGGEEGEDVMLSPA